MTDRRQFLQIAAGTAIPPMAAIAGSAAQGR